MTGMRANGHVIFDFLPVGGTARQTGEVKPMSAALVFQTLTLAAVNANETCFVGQKAF